MRVVVQRVSEASVSIQHNIRSNIHNGLLLLLGIGFDDSDEDIEWLCKKIINLRIFNDENGVMNKSLMDVNGELLVVSQFTLMAKAKKGNRPSYINAATPDIAVPLYQSFINKMNELTGKETKTGEFGADMQVSLVNDGPVTIILDTNNKE